MMPTDAVKHLSRFVNIKTTHTPPPETSSEDEPKPLQDFVYQSKLINVATRILEKQKINKFISGILNLRGTEQPEKNRSRSKASSNQATNGKNSTAGSRGNSKPRTRQGTPVNMPTTPSQQAKKTATASGKPAQIIQINNFISNGGGQDSHHNSKDK